MLYRQLRQALSRMLARLDLYSLYGLKRKGYLREMGWLRSVRERQSVNAAGQAIPWITYPALAFIETRLDPSMVVFEYGSGNSTLWWAARVSKVVSCEHDRNWYTRMQQRIPANVQLCHVELESDGSYAKEILRYPGMFDVIVIDGRERVSCAKNAVESLREGGVIILDNSDRQIYKEGCSYLKQRGFKRIDFCGLGPAYIYATCTSIFYLGDNCLGI